MARRSNIMSRSISPIAKEAKSDNVRSKCMRRVLPNDQTFVNSLGDVFSARSYTLSCLVRKVYATSTSFLPELDEAGVKDSAHCIFTFPSGAVFTLEMTRCSAYGYDNRIEVSHHRYGQGSSRNVTQAWPFQYHHVPSRNSQDMSWK